MNNMDGRVLDDPNLHDGRLLGISVSNNEQLELLCSSQDGVRVTLTLDKLVRLRADNFLEGNIIFDVNLYERVCPPGLLLRVFNEEGETLPSWLSDQMARLATGDWTLLELTSSYGCELIALAGSRLSVRRSQVRELHGETNPDTDAAETT